MRRITALMMVFLITLAALALPLQTRAQADERCFPETGYCISGNIRTYWEQNGGLPVFGFPITPLQEETIEGVWTGPVQWFERDRLEDHTADGEGVLAGRLGALALELEGTPWHTFPQVESAPQGCRYFEQTGHSVCPPFAAYWEQNGGVERFGYPITEAQEMTIDGWTGNVQYFERRRMEHHLENLGTEFEILLGLLGKEVREQVENGEGGNAGRIVFTSTRGGEQDVWVMQGNGTEPQNLTNNPDAQDFQPSWSNDGTKIAYVVGQAVTQNQNIWVMNADGSGKVQITDNPSADFAPTLSPDGSQVAFVSDRDGGFDIFVTSSDGSGEETNLTGPNEFSEFAPDWSPDGSRILYIADQEGLPNVWLMQTDGSGKSNITRNPDERQNNPAWSPDSSRIAYESDYYVDDQDIAVINADGTGRFGLVGTFPSENNPTWSPDGARIAYEKEGDIHTVKLDGSEGTNLTDSPDALDKDPDWVR